MSNKISLEKLCVLNNKNAIYLGNIVISHKQTIAYFDGDRESAGSLGDNSICDMMVEVHFVIYAYSIKSVKNGIWAKSLTKYYNIISIYFILHPCSQHDGNKLSCVFYHIYNED